MGTPEPSAAVLADEPTGNLAEHVVEAVIGVRRSLSA
jgi:ABC-type lipoprotein export system ATPase subunit